MNNILNDLSTPNLISAIELNLFAFMPVVGRWPRAQVHDETEILWSMTNVPFPVFNSIMRAQLTPARVDAVIEFVMAEAKSRSVPVLWWTGPTTQPGDLGRYLEEHGFSCAGQPPGMAAELGRLDEHPAMPVGFALQQATDNETLKQWSQVCAKGFGMPDFAGEAFYDVMCHADQDTTRAYLGRLGGEPVAASLLLLAAGVAGIYNVATIPQARRKGIGARMTDMPLLEARTMGYKAAILQASDMGESVYRSMGFQEYCKFGQYIWSPQ